MHTNPAKIVFFACLMLLSSTARAQRIPEWLIPAALSPILVIVLSLALGYLSRSWRTAGIHSGLVILWVVLFVFAANNVTNDYIIWTPMVLYIVHALLILVLIVMSIVNRVRLR